MKTRFITYILACLCTFKTISATEQLISFFFQPYPYAHAQTSTYLKKTGKMAKHTAEGLAQHNPINGILVVYGGYFDSSDINGHVVFPRKHELTTLPIIITNKIIPIAMMSNTIHHWELDPESPQAFFKAERKQDPQTKLVFWDIKPDKAPENNVIPVDAITIIAKPDQIYIPIGITLTTDTPNLNLPDMYVQKGINLIGNSLYMIKVSHLLAPVNYSYKKQEPKRSLMQIKTD